MEYWASLEPMGYPGYEVSTRGQVRRTGSGRPLSTSVNQRGFRKANLEVNDRYTAVAIGSLVAKAFVPVLQGCDPRACDPEVFDSVIHLDGDKTNDHAANLVWRPRNFAIQYHLQFSGRRTGYRIPIVDLDSGVVYATSWEAATTFGLLERKIVLHITNGDYIWPTGHNFDLNRQN